MLALLVIIYIAYISLGLPDSLLGTAWQAAWRLAYRFPWRNNLGRHIMQHHSFKPAEQQGNRGWGTGLTSNHQRSMTAAVRFPVAELLDHGPVAIPLGLGAGSVDTALNNFRGSPLQSQAHELAAFLLGYRRQPGTCHHVLLSCQKRLEVGYSTIGWIQNGLVVVLIDSLPLWMLASNGQKAAETSGKVFSIKELLKVKGARQALTAFFCYCAVESTAGLWGSSFLVLLRGICPETAASWVSLYYFGITLGRFISGFLTMRINNRNLIRIGLVLIVTGILLVMTPSIDFILMCGFFMIGLGCAPIFPSLIHDTPENFGSDMSQSMIGLQMACAYVGTTLMPPLFGLIGQYISMGLLPVYLMIIAIVMIAMVERLNRIKQGQAAAQTSNE